MVKKDWIPIYERVSCSNDVLELFHQNVNLPASFIEEVRKVQKQLGNLMDIAWENSLTKTERKEFFGE
jgi:hypothetical protein